MVAARRECGFNNTTSRYVATRGTIYLQIMFLKHRPKVLIIEDDKNNHPLYEKAFKENGFDVVLFDNADGFFPEDVSNENPDIISMDLMIGKEGKPTERDGFEAIEALKSDMRTYEIPIIVASSFFQENRVKRAKELGAIDYINLGGTSIQSIPKYFLSYLEDPKHYKPSHPSFKENN